MTPRERWLAVLHHQKPDRVPLDYRATPEFTRKLMDYLGVRTMDALRERLHLDPVVDATPRYVGPPIPPDQDVFGVRYVTANYGTGTYREPAFHPLAHFKSVEEVQREYRWPSPDWWDYSDLPRQVHGKEECVIRGGGSEPFATYKDLRGVAQGYLDLIDHPEMVHYCLEKLYHLCYQNTLRVYEAIPGKVIWTWVAEDLGSQEGLLVSLAHIRHFFLPHMKRMIELVHSAGAYVFHHSDGAIRPNLPNMIEAGIDVLDPVQWRAKGMEREGLVRDFGDRLVFHGGVDNQHTLAFGSVEDVRQEVLDNLRILGAKNGYILGPCHNIQPVSPPENVVAMYETAYEAG
ncbi:MAG: uroporphyrinogen decarboxylase family protein [Armatimonadota bacterium]|nr:uroporphyrinogen decarboxylase family protein [Armatimonadota bacterium]